ncbi:hypothetical protein ACTVZO_06050 [Streptomyces sp. IBSNAI002]|uniref:hypothetical protein n=1 Tax=Streptomyces sp. IBSNAI002 TaxID=3457500 RepID=UPI003FD454DE
MLEHWRFVGVMQRLAFAYLAVSLLYITCAWSLVSTDRPAAAQDATSARVGGRARAARFLARTLLLGGFPLVCLTVWTVATYSFHNAWPECAEVRVLTPDCSLQAYLDTSVWGTRHNFEGGKSDPEGLLSTLVAVVNCWAGLLVGLDVVRNKQRYSTMRAVRRRASLLMSLGVICAGGGLALGLLIPIGKQLWTPSFALVTIGIMTAGFGLVLLVSDGCRWPPPHGRVGDDTPLPANRIPRGSASAHHGLTAAARRRLASTGGTVVAFGRNPLFFYVLSELVITTLDYIPLRYHGEDTTLWSVGAQAGEAVGLPGPLASIIWALLWLSLFHAPLARLLTSRRWYIRV